MRESLFPCASGHFVFRRYQGEIAPMSPRSIRRAAERKALKQARKASHLAEPQLTDPYITEPQLTEPRAPGSVKKYLEHFWLEMFQVALIWGSEE
jgi:hypothetical protein